MHKVNQDTYARVFAELLDGAMTAYEAVEVIGLHIVTAQNLFRCLKKHKVVHIAGWQPNSRGMDTTPVYGLGYAKDKPRRKKSAAERQRVSRAKKAGLQAINGVVA
jgi:hypothetical protein